MSEDSIEELSCWVGLEMWWGVLENIGRSFCSLLEKLTDEEGGEY